MKKNKVVKSTEEATPDEQRKLVTDLGIHFTNTANEPRRILLVHDFPESAANSKMSFLGNRIDVATGIALMIKGAVENWGAGFLEDFQKELRRVATQDMEERTRVRE